MSQINCNIISDLLELYSDEVVTEDTKALVTEHLRECKECSDKLALIKQNLNIPAEIGTEPIKQIKRRIKKRNILVALVAVIIVVPTALFLVSAWAGRIVAIPFEETHIIGVEQGRDDWDLYVFFADNITEYAVQNRHIDETTMEVYFYFYKTNYERLFSPTNPADTYLTLNAHEDMVPQGGERIRRHTVRVYYSTFDAGGGRRDFSESHLLWEKEAEG